MNTQAEDATSVLDVVKQVFSVGLIVAGLSAFYYFSAEYPLLYRVLALVAVVVVAAVMLLTTAAGRNLWNFALESRQEVRKVVWPTREETTRTTLLVFGMVFVVGVILWILDGVLFWGVRLLTGQGG